MTFPGAMAWLTMGLVGGVFAGFFGIGGGILMVPVLLYSPQALGLPGLDMRAVAGLTMVQGFFAAAVGVLSHWQDRHVCKRLVLLMGGSALGGSFLGALLSAVVSPRSLLVIFALLALAAGGLMLLPRPEADREADPDTLRISLPLAITLSLGLSFLLGTVGQAGAFIYIPVMIHILGVPTRITIGSSLGIVALTASAGLIGKLATGQVPLDLGLLLAAGAMLGARVGSQFSRRVRAHTLRHALAGLILISAARIWLDIVR